jgi:ketosteroid isomerase-like protein
MRFVLGLLMLLAVSPAWAQSAEDASSIRSVISQQIEAFQHDDGAKAFSFAAPNIQGMFGTEQNFMAMVARGYQPVYRPRDVQFGTLADVDGTPTQRVDLIGPDGMAYTALYSMEKEADGSWKIAGCQILHSDKVGV